MKTEALIRTIAISVSTAVLATMGVLRIVLNIDTTIAIVVSVIFSIAFAVMIYLLEKVKIEAKMSIEKNLDVSIREALDKGSIGMLAYNDDYEITWMSEYFTNNGINEINGKILNWIPELQDIVEGDSTRTTVNIGDKKYIVTKMDKYSIMTFKDVSNEYNLQTRLNEEAYVVGLLSYDNIDEANLSEDDLFNVNTSIKMPVNEYFKKNGVVYYTLKNNRMLLMMNEKTYDKIYEDRFSILGKIRKVARDLDLPVTLSMAFSRGSSDLGELSSHADELIELAQTRGGDQVVVGKIGSDIMYFGGTSEAREKQSKTKIRVIISAIMDLIEHSDNVIICMHKTADADAVGSALAMSNIALDLDKKAYIISKSGGVEPMISEVLKKYNSDLIDKHRFISENDAADLLEDNSLVVMVDHHMAAQSNGTNILKRASKIIVIDHHRRNANLDVSTMLNYIEPSASSATELVCEFFPYMSKRFDIIEEEANIMYIGLLIDTDHFRVRTGARTFDVAKDLRRYGADPMVCDELCQEPYENTMLRASILNSTKKYNENIAIASCLEGIYPRSVASQAADVLIRSKGVAASFVICMISKEETIITARSRDDVNVQIIMEKMGGGGHMHAAGLQRNDTTVAKLENELYNVLEAYMKGE
ncbi:MAG: DHH family phosphoesterase [Erysipelotrichaceae bacterium]|nr:DHH family phosphoesterase [Erysipelotrichaceae bacterium]